MKTKLFLALFTTIAVSTLTPIAANAGDFKVSCPKGAIIEYVPETTMDGTVMPLTGTPSIVGATCKDEPGVVHTIRGFKGMTLASEADVKAFIKTAADMFGANKKVTVIDNPTVQKR